jgi:hypothetical protein
MSLEVIGAGFGRTGTLSLKTALDLLGYAPCYHMLECMPLGPEHWQLWVDAHTGSPDWDTIFRGRTATVDFPASTSWRALADHYPHARVILGMRDPERWYESTQETIFAPRWIEFLATSAASDFMDATINSYFDGRMHDKDHLIKRYREHIAAVQTAIPAERLLSFDVKEGWAPLCAFLDKPIPEQPFPHINDSQETKALIDAIIADGFEGLSSQ